MFSRGIIIDDLEGLRIIRTPCYDQNVTSLKWDFSKGMEEENGLLIDLHDIIKRHRWMRVDLKRQTI